MMHNTNVMVHFGPSSETDTWTGEDSVVRPRVVRRGITDLEDEIEDGKRGTILCSGSSERKSTVCSGHMRETRA